MIDEDALTATEIAEKYRRTVKYVQTYWISSPAWKERVRRGPNRGRAHTWNAADVHTLLREWVWLPPEDTTIPPDALMNLKEIADYTGLDYGTVRSDASTKGVLPPADAEEGGVRKWKRATVDTVYWARQRRPSRRKQGAS